MVIYKTLLFLIGISTVLGELQKSPCVPSYILTGQQTPLEITGEVKTLIGYNRGYNPFGYYPLKIPMVYSNLPCYFPGYLEELQIDLTNDKNYDKSNIQYVVEELKPVEDKDEREKHLSENQETKLLDIAEPTQLPPLISKPSDLSDFLDNTELQMPDQSTDNVISKDEVQEHISVVPQPPKLPLLTSEVEKPTQTSTVPESFVIPPPPKLPALSLPESLISYELENTSEIEVVPEPPELHPLTISSLPVPNVIVRPTQTIILLEKPLVYPPPPELPPFILPELPFISELEKPIEIPTAPEIPEPPVLPSLTISEIPTFNNFELPTENLKPPKNPSVFSQATQLPPLILPDAFVTEKPVEILFAPEKPLDLPQPPELPPLDFSVFSAPIDIENPKNTLTVSEKPLIIPQPPKLPHLNVLDFKNSIKIEGSPEKLIDIPQPPELPPLSNPKLLNPVDLKRPIEGPIVPKKPFVSSQPSEVPSVNVPESPFYFESEKSVEDVDASEKPFVIPQPPKLPPLSMSVNFENLPVPSLSLEKTSFASQPPELQTLFLSKLSDLEYIRKCIESSETPAIFPERTQYVKIVEPFTSKNQQVSENLELPFVFPAPCFRNIITENILPNIRLTSSNQPLRLFSTPSPVLPICRYINPTLL